MSTSGLLPLLYVTLLCTSVGACSLLPQGLVSEGDADQETEAVINLEGCVERALELEDENAILPLATRGCTRTTQLPES